MALYAASVKVNHPACRDLTKPFSRRSTDRSLSLLTRMARCRAASPSPTNRKINETMMRHAHHFRYLTSIALASIGIAFAAASQAQLRFEISGVGASRIPVAIATFPGEQGAPQQITAIV